MGELVQLFGKATKPEGGGRTVYLAFTAGERKWALLPVDLAEVVSKTVPLAIPKAGTAWATGVINQRGRIIPIVDFEIRLGRPPMARPEEGSIVVVQADGKYAGILVQSVCDGLRDVAGQPVPTEAGRWPGFVRSVINAPDGEFGLLTPKDLFSEADLQELERVRAQF